MQAYTKTLTKLALLASVLLLACSVASGEDASTEPASVATAREFAWQLLHGNYDVAASMVDDREDRLRFEVAFQGLMALVGRPIEILSAADDPERSGVVAVSVRCQRETVNLDVTLDQRGRATDISLVVNPKPDRPMTGEAVPDLTSFDAVVGDLMRRWNIVGLSLAVLKDGRLVLARGYGFADLENGLAVQPTSLFRIASLSKPITAAAVLRLVEQGRLGLDAHPFEMLAHLEPPALARIDPRLRKITVRQLLWHAGGWDRDATFDPMFLPLQSAKAVGAPQPASCETVIRYMLGRPLDFDPGSRHAYSNFGYCVLGRLIEEVSGESYESFVRKELLEPSGITDMHLGASRIEGRRPGEVRYYDHAGARWVPSVFPDEEDPVPVPYGGFHLEAMAAHGGWIASSIDLARLIVRLDGHTTPPDLLGPQALGAMVARPDLDEWKDTSYWVSMGWYVRQTVEGANWWHFGSLAGTTSLFVRAPGGMGWVVLLNSRPEPGRWSEFDGQIDRAMWHAVQTVREWPKHDLFENYPPTPADAP